MQVEIGGEATGPLRGVTVLDLTSVVSGPLCTQTLGDLGAEVIKVEPPQGDTSRRLGFPGKAGFAAYFAQFNRNKRSLVLDLKNPSALEVVHRLVRRAAADGARLVLLPEVVHRLVRRADVLLENWRPEVAGRLGLGFEELSIENPRLIYVSINGFGPDGPYKDQPAYDTVIQVLTGFMHTQGGGPDSPSG